jgi:hypothetical protein
VQLTPSPPPLKPPAEKYYYIQRDAGLFKEPCDGTPIFAAGNDIISGERDVALLHVLLGTDSREEV